MRRIVFAWAAAGLLAAATSPLLFAGDAPAPAPAPPAGAADDARVQRLVEDLGSDDFRVREAATKELTQMGEKARSALEAAAKSDRPGVRFRAEQILDRLNGSPREKPLGDGETPPRADRPRRPSPVDGLRPEDWDREVNRLREEMDRRMRELEESFRSGRMDFPWGGSWGPYLLGRDRTARGARDLRLRVDGGEVWAELYEGPRGARIVFTEKDEPTNVTTYSGASVAKILESRPQVRDWPGAKDLLARYDAEKKAREEAAKQAPPGDGAGRAIVQGRSVQVMQDEHGVRVTITETGPDGKPVSKTYEGTDLETLKREHPELADSLGGFTLRMGPMTRAPDDGTPGERPLGPLDSDEDEPTVPGSAATPATGPFGLALAKVDEPLRAQLGLAAGAGALVVAVRPDSEAAKVGLRVDDVITEVDGTAVRTLDVVANTIRSRPQGAALRFEVFRNGHRTTLPESMPPK